MEKYIKIPTPDGFEINGVLNSKTNSDKLIIFVHGFTGSMNEAHYYCAKEYFVQKRYDVFRFNLYTDWKNTRKMRDCSVEIHANDIQLVSEYFMNYSEIYLVGHSLAWPCFSMVNVYTQNCKKIIFWDPAFEMKTTWKKFYSEGNIFKHQSSWKHLEISQMMRDEFLEDNFLEKLEEQKFSKRHMFAIYADGDRHINNKLQTDEMGIESYVIEWSNHWFTQEWKFEELFAKTLEFIEK